MNPRVVEVKPNPDYSLILKFTNGEVRRFDVGPYLDKGVFRELKDVRLFNSVKPSLGSIAWLRNRLKISIRQINLIDGHVPVLQRTQIVRDISSKC